MPTDAALRRSLSALQSILAGAGGRYGIFAASYFVVALLEVAGVGLLPAFIAALNEPRAILAQAGLSHIAFLAQAGDERIITIAGAVLAAFFIVKNLALAGIA